jgi:hypothetical protein
MAACAGLARLRSLLKGFGQPVSEERALWRRQAQIIVDEPRHGHALHDGRHQGGADLPVWTAAQQRHQRTEEMITARASDDVGRRLGGEGAQDDHQAFQPRIVGGRIDHQARRALAEPLDPVAEELGGLGRGLKNLEQELFLGAEIAKDQGCIDACTAGDLPQAGRVVAFRPEFSACAVQNCFTCGLGVARAMRSEGKRQIFTTFRLGSALIMAESVTL